VEGEMVVPSDVERAVGIFCLLVFPALWQLVFGFAASCACVCALFPLRVWQSGPARPV